MDNFNIAAGRAWFDSLPTESKSPKGFDAWMTKVAAIIERKCGVSYLDLPDYRYADEYEDGSTPSQAAAAAIRYAREG